AQPLPSANLLQQGAGLLNIDGAIALTKSLRTDLATAIQNGTILPGQSTLAVGAVLPATTSAINGPSFNWSRIVVVGGNRIVSGSALFTKFHPLWDPRIVWAKDVVRQRTLVYWSGWGIAANTYAK